MNRYKQKAAGIRGFFYIRRNQGGAYSQKATLPLTGLEPWVPLVNDVNPPLPAHDTTVFVPLLSGFERATHFHRFDPYIVLCVATRAFPEPEERGLYRTPYRSARGPANSQ